METFAFIHASAAYEDSAPEPQLRSIEEINLNVSNSAILGVAGAAAGLAVIGQAPDANALVGFGDRGAAVSAVQEVLLDEGYDVGLADGIFGAGTEDAVIRYQIDGGLSADGVVGPSTAAAMGLADPADPDSPYAGGSAGGGGGGGSEGTITVSTNGGDLTIRSGPGSGYSAVGSLVNGATTTYVSYSNGWYQIGAGGGGWVSESWVTEGSGGGGGGGGGGGSCNISGGGDTGATAFVNTNGNPLTVRSGPGSNFAAVDSLPNGTRITILSVNDCWGLVPASGWVSLDWVTQ